MSLINAVTRLFAPFRCLSCNIERDALLCEDCAVLVPGSPSSCYRCHAATRHFEVCKSCRSKVALRRVAAWTYYDGLARDLLHVAKYERAKDGLIEIGGLIAPLLDVFGVGVILVPVPTASSRVRQRGYDHAKVIAEEVARQSGLALLPCLKRLGQAHQVGSGRAERHRQLAGVFYVDQIDHIKGKHIVLLTMFVLPDRHLKKRLAPLSEPGLLE